MKRIGIAAGDKEVLEKLYFLKLDSFPPIEYDNECGTHALSKWHGKEDYTDGDYKRYSLYWCQRP